jgi:multiple antibiotic resistance protein
MDLASAVITLFLIMDPLGNVPILLSVLKSVPPERRCKILVREVLIAYFVLLSHDFSIESSESAD